MFYFDRTQSKASALHSTDTFAYTADIIFQNSMSQSDPTDSFFLCIFQVSKYNHQSKKETRKKYLVKE